MIQHNLLLSLVNDYKPLSCSNLYVVLFLFNILDSIYITIFSKSIKNNYIIHILGMNMSINNMTRKIAILYYFGICTITLSLALI